MFLKLRISYLVGWTSKFTRVQLIIYYHNFSILSAYQLLSKASDQKNVWIQKAATSHPYKKLQLARSANDDGGFTTVAREKNIAKLFFSRFH